MFSARFGCTVAPVIEQFHFPRHLQLGMRARLVCTVISGDPPFTIRWLHNDTQIWTGSATGSRSPVLSSASASSFSSSSSSSSSSAVVSLSASASSSVSAPFQPTTPSFSFVSSASDQVQLTGVTGKVDEFSADLSFQSVSVQHNGNYTCEVHNDLASARHTAQLVVEGKKSKFPDQVENENKTKNDSHSV